MFGYLSKKINMPSGTVLRSLAWNSQQGWLACGGDNGLLKVVKLPDKEGSMDEKKDNFTTAQSNLPINQTLEGHQGSVLVVSWNENYRKLTSSDERGLIIVWILHKGLWFEEMINNRSRSVVQDMRWSADGQRICIVYEDGHVIVGSVDGNRIWGKSLNHKLSNVTWSPDGRLLLFCTKEGKCNIHDYHGNFLSQLTILFEVNGERPLIASIDWYNGLEGYIDRNAPTLVIALCSGKIQMMKHELDEDPILVDTKIRLSCVKWTPNGEFLGVVGLEASSTSEFHPTTQVYSQLGIHLWTINVPGHSINNLAWEGEGMKLALVAGSSIYIANIRRKYMWTFINGKTCVYGFKRKDYEEHTIMFWDIKSDKRCSKYINNLIGICGGKNNCILAAKAQEENQYVLVLCESSGDPIMSKNVKIEPLFLAMNSKHVFFAKENTICLWEYQSTLPQTPSKKYKYKNENNDSKDGNQVFIHKLQNDLENEGDNIFSNENICCICVSEKILLVGCESGVLHQFSVPSMFLLSKHHVQCKPQEMNLNCDSTWISIIDVHGVLRLHSLPKDFSHKDPTQNGIDTLPLDCKRTNVWSMKWADDNPQLIAVMEKDRMYILRGTELEEPISCDAYLCNFHDLQIHAIKLDQLMQQPENPGKDHIFYYETKSLRDTTNLLKVVELQDAFSYIEEHQHHKLWTYLAEHALEKFDLSIAEKAFVKCQNYYGIWFVKRLCTIANAEVQKAEVYAYFKKFDEAERVLLQLGKVDEAIEFNIKYGRWFSAKKLIEDHNKKKTILDEVYNKIGDFHFDNHQWNEAISFYTKTKNHEKLQDCLYANGDWSALEKLMKSSSNNKIILAIAQKFSNVGQCEQAVDGYLKCGKTRDAVECCMDLNRWDLSVQIAKNYELDEDLLEKVLVYDDNTHPKSKAIRAS